MDKGVSLRDSLTVLRSIRKCYKSAGLYNEMGELTQLICKTKREMAHLHGAIETGKPTGRLEYETRRPFAANHAIG